MGIKINDTLEPRGSTYPLLEDINLKGGYRSVADITARDSIREADLKEGMLVYVRSDDTLYQLAADLTTWNVFTAGGGGGTTLTYATMAALRAGDLPDDGTVAVLAGYHSSNDGGGGQFIFSAASNAADNIGFVVKPTAAGAGAGRWLRMVSDTAWASVKWFGAVGDGTSHPLSAYFGSLGAAQAVYPHATTLSNEIDWAAAQAAVDLLDNGWGVETHGGEVFFPEGTYYFDTALDLDWSFGMKLSGVTWGLRINLKEAAASHIVYTSASQYLNASNTKPCISARTSYYFTLTNLNVSYSSPSYHGHLIELSHRGGNSVATKALLPTMTFAGSTITRASGSFVDDGWRVGDVVHVAGSVSNNSNFGTIVSVTDLVITTDNVWVNEVVNFTGTNGIYSATGDTTFATIENCVFSSSGATTPGTGAKALLAMTSAIICTVSNCFFGTAERGIVFRDFEGGPGIYSNAHIIRNCSFEYMTDAICNAGQDILIDGCTIEGLSGVMRSAYYDDQVFVQAATDCTFAFDSGAKTVTRSSGSWITDGWTVGMTASYGGDNGFYGPMGTITVLTATVMTLDGAVPNYAATYDYYVYNDTALSGAGIQSDPRVGNTLTVAGSTITRSSGSWIDDGCVIGMSLFGYGGGQYPAIADMTDSVITLTSAAPGAGVYTDPYYYLWGDGGGGPITFIGCWFGDQYRYDSWLHTVGCGGINLIGNFFNGNARVLRNRNKLLRGSVTGNVLVVGRDQEAFLCTGVNGVSGFSMRGNVGGSIRFKTGIQPNNYDVSANSPLIETEAIQVSDDTFVKKIERFSQGLVVHSTIYDPYGTTTPRALLDVRGSLALGYTSTAADLTLDRTHYFVDVDATAANRTITLPSASGITGREYVVKRVDGSGFTCTLTAAGGETIDGAASVPLLTQNSALTVVSNGSNWRIKSAY